MAAIIEAGPIPPAKGLDLCRMTVEEYERLAEAGILRDPRVELIDGYLERKEFRPGKSVPLALDGRELGRIEVSNILE